MSENTDVSDAIGSHQFNTADVYPMVSRLKRASWDDVFAQADRELANLPLQGLASYGFISLYATAGTGKTHWLLRHILPALCRGEEAGPFRPSRPLSCAYISLEQDPTSLVQTIARGDGERAVDAVESVALYFANGRGRCAVKELASACSEHDVVAVNSLAFLEEAVDISDPASALVLGQSLAEMAQRHRCVLVVEAHTTKANMYGKHSARGSSTLRDMAEAFIELKPGKGDSVVFESNKLRFGRPWRWEASPTHGWRKLTSKGEQEVPGDDVKAAIVKFVRTNPGSNVSAIRKAVKGAGNEKCKVLLDELVAAGVLRDDAEGRGKCYRFCGSEPSGTKTESDG